MADCTEVAFLCGLVGSYALGFVLWMMATGQDVLELPVLQRHRYFRLKQAIPISMFLCNPVQSAYKHVDVCTYNGCCTTDRITHLMKIT